MPVHAGMIRPRAPLPVAGVDVHPELAPARFAPLVYADFARDRAMGLTWGDAASGCVWSLVKL